MRSAHAPVRRALRAAIAPTLTLAAAVALAACGTGVSSAGPTTGVGAATSEPTVAATAAPSVATRTPGPTPLQILPLGLLPQAEVPADVEVSCEDAAGATLSCDDAVTLAARIAITMTGGSPIEQVLVERDAADANLVTLTYWAVDPETPDDPAVPFQTVIDVSGQTMTIPTQIELEFPG